MSVSLRKTAPGLEPSRGLIVLQHLGDLRHARADQIAFVLGGLCHDAVDQIGVDF